MQQLPGEKILAVCINKKPGNLPGRSQRRVLVDEINRMQGLELFEEVIALVIDQDECREIFHFNFVNRFHTEFRILNTLNAADSFFCEVRGNTADRSKIEAAVFLTGFGNYVSTIALSDHNEGTAGSHERISIRIHTVSCCRAH